MIEDIHRIRPRVYIVIPGFKRYIPVSFRLQDLPSPLPPEDILPLEFRFASPRGPERIETSSGQSVTVDIFRSIRESRGGWIETTDKPRICSVLGVSEEEAGIVEMSSEALRF